MVADPPELTVVDVVAWCAWLTEHHDEKAGVWHVLVKKGTTEPTGLTYDQALDEALTYGWIDGSVRRRDDATYACALHTAGPRRSARSVTGDPPWCEFVRESAKGVLVPLPNGVMVRRPRLPDLRCPTEDELLVLLDAACAENVGDREPRLLRRRLQPPKRRTVGDHLLMQPRPVSDRTPYSTNRHNVIRHSATVCTSRRLVPPACWAA